MAPTRDGVARRGSWEVCGGIGRTIPTVVGIRIQEGNRIRQMSGWEKLHNSHHEEGTSSLTFLRGLW